MGSPPIIIKHYYVQTGSPPPINSRYKGDTVTSAGIIGTIEYTASKHADDLSLKKLSEKSLDWLLKKGKIQAKDGTFNYTNKHDETITNQGYIENEKQRINFMKKADSSILDEGHIVHYFIISMKDYATAADFGYYTYKEWTKLAIDSIPSISKTLGYDPNNTMWWADFHHDKFNPHLHLQIFEKKDKGNDESFDFERGTIPNKKLNKIKRDVLENIYVNQQLEKDYQLTKKQYLDQLDESTSELVDMSRMILVKPAMIPTLKELQYALPKTGRLQYHAKNMLPYKKEIDRYIDYILKNNDELKSKFDSIMDKASYLDQLYNKQLGDNLVSRIEQTQFKKIREGIGNQLLNQVKTTDLRISKDDYAYLSIEDQEILNMIENKDKFMSIYAPIFSKHLGHAIQKTMNFNDFDIDIDYTQIVDSVEKAVKNVVTQEMLNNVNVNRYSFTNQNAKFTVKYSDSQMQHLLSKFLGRLDLEILKVLDEFIMENDIDLFDFRNDLILSDGTIYAKSR